MIVLSKRLSRVPARLHNAAYLIWFLLGNPLVIFFGCRINGLRNFSKSGQDRATGI
jgi:hypothetical protein